MLVKEKGLAAVNMTPETALTTIRMLNFRLMSVEVLLIGSNPLYKIKESISMSKLTSGDHSPFETGPFDQTVSSSLL